MSREGYDSPELPHMQYEAAWELGGPPDSHLPYDYLVWLANSPERIQSAIDTMQWLPPGFNTFPVVRATNPDGTTQCSIQLNLYHPDHPGNEEPHGHSRNARTAWYALPGTRQVIHRYGIVGKGASRIDGLDVDEYVVAGNCIIDLKDGRRPRYHVVELGAELLIRQSITYTASLVYQEFASTEVHHIGFLGDGVAISAHYKGQEESPVLSGIGGLMSYKRVDRQGAERLISERETLLKELTTIPSLASPRLGPTTMMYMHPSSVASIESEPTKTSADIAERLIVGALYTAERLRRVA